MGWSSVVRRGLGVVAIAGLVACSTKPAPEPAPPAGPPVRVELVPAALLLPAVGASQALVVRAFDATGRAASTEGVQLVATGEAIAVSADGVVTAQALGNGAVTATLGTLSARASVVVATPAAGATLVSDAQVLGDLRPVDPTAPFAPGYRYEVTLSGVEPMPAVGSLLIGTGEQPVGGRVVAVDGDTVVIELVPLDELFPAFTLDETIPLVDAPLELNPRVTEAFDVTPGPGGELTLRLKDGVEPRGVSRKYHGKSPPSGKFEFELGPMDCAVETSAFQLSLAKLEFTLDPGLTLERTWSDEEKRVVVTSHAKATLVVKPSLQAQLEGKLTCELEVGKRHIPLPGPIGLLLGFAVPFGVGFEVEAKVPIASGFSVEFKRQLSATARAGFQCIAGDCAPVGEFTNTSTPATVTSPPVSFELPPSLRAEASVYVYGFAKLEFGGSQVVSSAAGATGWRRIEAELLALKLGLKLEGKFASDVAQVVDPAFAAEYRLLFEAGLEAGGSLESFIAFMKITTLKLEVKFPLELATSPKGALVVTPGTFAAGDPLRFEVSLQPSTLSFPIIGFNPKHVRVYRKVNTPTELTLQLAAEAPWPDGASTLSLTGVASETGADAAYVALLETKFLGLLGLELETQPGPVLELDVTFPQMVQADRATPLQLTARLRDPRTNSTTPAAMATVSATPTGASVSAASLRTDATGALTLDVRPAMGATMLSVGLAVEAANGVKALANVSATVTMGAACTATNLRTVSSAVFIESEADALAAADIGSTTSTLGIRGNGPAFAVDLPCLTSVGSLEITGSAVTRVNLSALRQVTSSSGGAIYGAASLVSLRMPSLAGAPGGLVIGRFFAGSPPTTFPNSSLTELVIGGAQLGTSGRFELHSNPQLVDLSGVSSALRVPGNFVFGSGAIANGFGRTAGLALANRITVQGSVCEADGATLPTCFMGPPWAP